MEHRFNRRAFGTVDRSATNPLLESYAVLVAVELALKDALWSADGQWRKLHGVAKFAQDLIDSAHAQATPPVVYERNWKRLQDASIALKEKLSRLVCTDKKGNLSLVGDQFPNVRYLRHEDDFPADFSTSTDVEELRIATRELEAALNDCLQETGKDKVIP